jgi:hypothetical protein
MVSQDRETHRHCVLEKRGGQMVPVGRHFLICKMVTMAFVQRGYKDKIIQYFGKYCMIFL